MPMPMYKSGLDGRKVDVDDFECEGIYRQLMSRFGHYRWVCCSTASSKEELPKFRLVFPLREMSLQIRSNTSGMHCSLNWEILVISKLKIFEDVLHPCQVSGCV